MATRPLEGIRIADFGWIFAVPHATAWLGALGAEVIRVETSVAYDIIRFLTGTDAIPGPNRSGVFNSINTSRKSIAVNLAMREGQEIARRLVAKSDIVTENFTVGNMAKSGLSYDELVKIKPDLIMLSGTPLGQTGPYARTVGWGPTTQAYAGLCEITGYPGADSFPCGIGGTWPDFAIGTGMVFFLLAALNYRDRTGEGQHLDLSMAEMVATMMPEAMMEVALTGREPARIGNRDDAMAPHGVYPAAGDDQWIAIAIASDAEFAALAEALEAGAIASDARYASTAARLRNVDMLDAEVAARTRGFARDDLVERLRERGIAAGPVYSVPELMNDRAFIESGMLRTLKHFEVGERVVPGIPASFSATDLDYFGSPAIGEHTDEVLTGLLGYSADEVTKLREQKVLI